MTEPKRATWREFVEWVAQIEWETSDAGSECWSTKRLLAAAKAVRTRGEAVAAVIGAVDLLPSDVGELMGRWADHLSAQGLLTPRLPFSGESASADPPSVAEVLESVATNMESAANVPQATDPSDYFRGFDAGQASAYANAAVVLRDKAKEFA